MGSEDAVSAKMLYQNAAVGTVVDNNLFLNMAGSYQEFELTLCSVYGH
jgi:hypothetical protein